MTETPAKQYVRKMTQPDAQERRMRKEVRVMLARVGPRYGLYNDAMVMARDAAIAHLAHSHACLSAIERSLVPR